MSSTSFRLVLPRQIHTAILQHARTEYPNECCGLLAGRRDGPAAVTVSRDYPLVNELASPTRYQSEPRSILAACKAIDRDGLDEVGVYHSHPTSPPVPSRIDLANNFRGSDVVHVIVSLEADPPAVRAWRLFDDRYEEVAMEVVENS